MMAIVANAGISIIESAGEGIDEVRTGLASLTLAANVEKLIYIGTGSFTGTGNASNNVITGGAANDVLIGGAGADELIGGNGYDVAAYGSSAITLNFKTGVHIGEAAGDTFNGIEAFTGSSLDDTFVSGTDAHIMNGGGGIDTIDYSTSAEAISVNLTSGTGVGGDATGDSFTFIERVIGTAFADVLSSASSGHRLEGGAGDDTYLVDSVGASVTEAIDGGVDEIRTGLATYSLASRANVENLQYIGLAAFLGTGNALDNVITGAVGNDVLTGANGADTLVGADGDDVLIGGDGPDQLIGGSGVDVASYEDWTSGIIFNPSGGSTGAAANDSLIGIEAVRGTRYSDLFIADQELLEYQGGLGVDYVSYASSSAAIVVDMTTLTNGGDATGDSYVSIETIIGTAYGDTLLGNSENNIFVGNGGDNIVDGRSGVDGIWYVNSMSGVEVDLSQGYGATVAGGSDELIGIEDVIGSSFDDTIIGNGLANRLEGGLGSDIIFGGDGDDILSGYSQSTTGYVTPTAGLGLQDSDTLFGGSGNDLISISSGIGAGEDGNDKLTSLNVNSELYGGAGNDILRSYYGGIMEGGEGADEYQFDGYGGMTYILDDGTAGRDVVFTPFFSVSEALFLREGDDLLLVYKYDYQENGQKIGVTLVDWYAGYNSIELFVTTNHEGFYGP